MGACVSALIAAQADCARRACHGKTYAGICCRGHRVIEHLRRRCTSKARFLTICTCVHEWRVYMVITIDTSALIAVIGNEDSKQKIIEITKGCSLCAPMSVHWEIGNALSAMFKRRSSNIEFAKQALAAYREIPISYISVPLEKTLEISHSQNIYAYDAYLVQCAQKTSTSLLTLDKKLKAIAKKMGVTILEIEQ